VYEKLFIQLINCFNADRQTGGFNQPGVNDDAFIDDQLICFELSYDLGIDFIDYERFNLGIK
tara:strand:- start:2015 stop:2200 length:186 start_codon:yes stop_codon:yes gene_type:complete